MDSGVDLAFFLAFAGARRARAGVDFVASSFATGCAFRTGPGTTPGGPTVSPTLSCPETLSALIEIKAQRSKSRSRHNFMSGKLVVRLWPLQVRRAAGIFGPMTLPAVQSIRFRSLPVRRVTPFYLCHANVARHIAHKS